MAGEAFEFSAALDQEFVFQLDLKWAAPLMMLANSKQLFDYSNVSYHKKD